MAKIIMNIKNFAIMRKNIGEYFIPICERLGQNKKKYFSSIPNRLGKNIVAPIRRLLFNFLKYFIDNSAVNLIIIKYLFINGGA